MFFMDKISKLFKTKNDYEQLKKNKKLPTLKEPIQTYNRKNNQWSKMFYREYPQNKAISDSLNKRG